MCVGDVVALTLWFLRHPERSGIFNVGSERSQPFNDVAHATINEMHVERGEAALALAEQVAAGLIEYTSFPQALIGRSVPNPGRSHRAARERLAGQG